MRVYLDSCVWLRPYDDQRHMRIRRETQAVIAILEAAERGEISLVASTLVRGEIEGHTSLRKQEAVEQLTICRIEAPLDPDSAALAQELRASLGLSPEDALHLSLSAETAEEFLTCDDELLTQAKKAEDILARRGHPLRIQNPVDFIQQWQKPKK